ncbi:MAG TPA: MlaD family protein, partial [Rudaea sp.]|nr:MlaD family protein [Rudaea sp.]
RLPLVWIVPLVAALIGGWVAVHAILDRGPTISISFADAEGIEAGKTKIRYKSVDAGLVREVTLAPDHHTVNLTVDMEKFAKPLLVRGTRFWIVRPRLGAGGVSGLGTLFSGAYIGMDLGDSTDVAREFVGLESPPVVTDTMKGKHYTLHAHDVGSLGVGAPAYFRRIQVGEISALSLDPDGHGVTLNLFVDSPYDRFVTDDTRFWHASGVDVALDASGLRVETESLSAILAGGIAFEAPAGSTATSPTPPGSEFHLASDRAAAMKSVDRVVETYVLTFDESLRGLSPGAAVNFHGVDIGEVTAINVDYDATAKKFLFPVSINVYPERIRSRYLEGAVRPERKAHALVASMIEQGIRAQLRTGSLLTGQLYIAIDFFPNVTKVVPQPELTPMPIPTIPGDLEELQNTVVHIAHKLDQLPLDRIGNDLDTALVTLSGALKSFDHLVGDVDSKVAPEARAAFAQATVTLAQTQQAIAPDATLQNDLHNTLSSVGRAADSVRVLADYLEKHPESLVRGKTKDK